jgi:hypothetical protein
MVLFLLSCKTNAEKDYRGEIIIGKTYPNEEGLFKVERKDSLGKIMDTVSISSLEFVRFEYDESGEEVRQFLISPNHIDTLNRIEYEGESSESTAVIDNHDLFTWILTVDNNDLFFHVYSLQVSDYVKSFYLYGVDTLTGEYEYLMHKDLESNYFVVNVDVNKKIESYNQFYACVYYFDLNDLEKDGAYVLKSCKPFRFEW